MCCSVNVLAIRRICYSAGIVVPSRLGPATARCRGLSDTTMPLISFHDRDC